MSIFESIFPARLPMDGNSVGGTEQLQNLIMMSVSTMRWLQQKYSAFFIISVLLHIVLIFFLFTSVIFNSAIPYVEKKGDAPTVVNASIINQNQIQQEVARLKQQQDAKRRAEQEHVEKMRELARQAERQRHEELEHLKQLREQQKEMQEKQLAEQKAAQEKLAELKRQAKIEQRQLAAKAKAVQEQKHQRLAEKRKALAQEKQEQTQQVTQEHKKEDADDLLQQQLAQESKQLEASRAQYTNGIINKYNALIIQAIRQNWIVPLGIDTSLKVRVQIRLGDGGVVLDAEVVQSSGNVALDRSAITAIYKASPLPVPANANIFNQFRQFSMTMTPGDKLT